MQDYRKLIVWERTHAHTLKVRLATKQFPNKGYSNLKSQMTRAAESIGYNIVEGCGSSTANEFARYLDISIKSASELDYQLLLSKGYGVLSEIDWAAHSKETIEIRRMLSKLRGKVLDRLPRPDAKPGKRRKC
jgi:four helix bundle protein